MSSYPQVPFVPNVHMVWQNTSIQKKFGRFQVISYLAGTVILQRLISTVLLRTFVFCELLTNDVLLTALTGFMHTFPIICQKNDFLNCRPHYLNPVY